MKQLDLDWGLSIPDDDQIVWYDNEDWAYYEVDDYGMKIIDPYVEESIDYDHQDWNQLVEDLGLDNLPF